MDAVVDNPQAITVDYTLHIALGIIGVLLVGIASVVGSYFTGVIKKIIERLEKHEDMFISHNNMIRDQDTEIKLMKQSFTTNNRELAELIVTKMRAAGGAHSG